MIRLKWIDHQSDRIHSSHIWLKNSQNGRKYSFLTEYIAPENGREEDCYIIGKICDSEIRAGINYDIQLLLYQLRT